MGWRWLGALAAAALLATGCTSTDARVSLPTPKPTYDSYVALGDSFTAGPFIPTTQLAEGCLRSDHNYPRLLAEDLDIEQVVDVSCSAALTRDITHTQLTLPGGKVRAQDRALTADTDLVTLGIGGNDFDLFQSLTFTGGRLASPAATTRKIGQRIARTLRDIQSKAPEAKVVLVGYLRLIDPGTSCPDRLPFSPAQLAAGNRVQVLLNEAMRKAAGSTGATFVDMYAASAGHGICAADPWVNGKTTDQSRALAYHPFESGMRAVADEIADALD